MKPEPLTQQAGFFIKESQHLKGTGFLFIQNTIF